MILIMTYQNPIKHKFNGIVVKINSRKLQLIREKSYGCYPHCAMAIEY